MEIINQPFDGTLGDRLIEIINSQDYHTLNISVAFAKNSGVLKIKDAIELFKKQGGQVNIYLGIDMKVTSYEALTNLLTISNSLSIIHSEQGQTFHSKIYQFLGDKTNIAIVGSNNLTSGGLWTNFESSILISTDNLTNTDTYLLDHINQYFKTISLLEGLCKKIKSQEDIDLLLQHGYILKEVEEKINQSLVFKKRIPQQKLFGNQYIRLAKTRQPQRYSKLLVNPKLPIQNISSDENQTIWFETRKMTGGSRNILDLSKISLVEEGDYKNTPFDFGNAKFMKGAVQFFDLNPSLDIDKKKDIVINFEGVDYRDNTILYPVGEKANGTWRLQIKGVDQLSNTKITQRFQSKTENGEYYLVDKIITLTKINSNYYFMSVFCSSELDNFKRSSRIVARNGSSENSKYMGIL
jgi:hypothetical protein